MFGCGLCGAHDPCKHRRANLIFQILAQSGGATNMCITYFAGFKDKFEFGSSALDGIPENSSDLERGAAPRSIGDVFAGIPSMFIEI